MNKEPDIAVIPESGDWAKKIPDAEAICRRAALAALEAVAPKGVEATIELSILLADDAAVRDLNRDWRGKDKPTNVLSFPASDLTCEDWGSAPRDLPLLLGDVALALETVLSEAAGQGKTPADHLSHLVVHGVLHLAGFDHEEDEEAERMEGLEVRILAALGVGDPYMSERAS